MNTKTMRLPPRRVLTPSASSPNNGNKRKERDEGLERPKPKPSPSSNIPTTTLNPTKFLKPRAGFEPPWSSRKGSEPTSPNQLLAGFLAHEFLTNGTLFGEAWEPSGPTEADHDKRESESKSSQTREAEPEKKKPERYAELAELLRGSGTHIPGIVNPTQLSRFLHL